MRFTSSVRKAVSSILVVLSLLEWSGAGAAFCAGSPEPALLLKFSGPAVPPAGARDRYAAVAEVLGRRLRIRPVSLPAGSREGGDLPSGIDDGTLKAAARRVAEAGRKMDRLENREADRDLAALEGELRRFALGDATGPLLCDVFLKRATIAVWEGDTVRATSFMRKASVLRPGYEPSAALHSPQFRQLWAGIPGGGTETADLVVESVPSGGRISVDGTDRGAAPLKIVIPATRPVRLKVEHPGFRPSEVVRRWFPGDSEKIEIVLHGDREARLAGLLSGSRRSFREAAPIVAEMASESGVKRVAILLLDREAGADVLRVLSATDSSPEPRMLGEVGIGDGSARAAAAAEEVARLLEGAGWPADPDAAQVSRRPWYYRWWFLTGLGLLVAGGVLALNGGGGGGNAGGTTSSDSGVNF
jgi:hypothetical protein